MHCLVDPRLHGGLIRLRMLAHQARQQGGPPSIKVLVINLHEELQRLEERGRYSIRGVLEHSREHTLHVLDLLLTGKQNETSFHIESVSSLKLFTAEL